MSALGAFNTQLIKFFEDLRDTFPEEKEIRVALEAIQGAKKINPRLILDMFYEHVGRDLRGAIQNQDEKAIIAYAKQKIQVQYNEILPALSIFDKHWPSLSEANQEVIWKYLKVLIVLCDKARA